MQFSLEAHFIFTFIPMHVILYNFNFKQIINCFTVVKIPKYHDNSSGS